MFHFAYERRSPALTVGFQEVQPLLHSLELRLSRAGDLWLLFSCSNLQHLSICPSPSSRAESVCFAADEAFHLPCDFEHNQHVGGARHDTAVRRTVVCALILRQEHFAAYLVRNQAPE